MSNQHITKRILSATKEDIRELRLVIKFMLPSLSSFERDAFLLACDEREFALNELKG